MAQLDDQRYQNPLLDDREDPDPLSLNVSGSGEASSKSTATAFSATANLCNAILGAGLLALPYGFANAGYIVTIALLVIAGSASVFTMHLLTSCGREIAGSDATFYALGKRALPGRACSIVDCSIVIMCFGLATSYVIVFSTLFPGALERLVGPKRILRTHPVDLLSRQLWVVMNGFIVAPLAFQESFENLQFTSTLGVVFVAYGSVMVLVYYFHAFGADECRDDDNFDCTRPKSLDAVTFNRGIGPLTALSIVIFSFTAHAQVLGISNELKNYTQKKMDLVAGMAILICGALYIAVGMAGYATFGDKVSSDLLENYPGDEVAVVISRLGFSALVAFSYPLMCKPARDSLLSLVENGAFGSEAAEKLKDPLSAPSHRKLIYRAFTTSFLVGTCGIACVVNDLGVILSLIGATCSTFVAFVIPPLVFIKTHPEPSIKKNAAKFVLGMGVVLMPTMCVATFLGK